MNFWKLIEDAVPGMGKKSNRESTIYKKHSTRYQIDVDVFCTNLVILHSELQYKFTFFKNSFALKLTIWSKNDYLATILDYLAYKLFLIVKLKYLII